MPLERTSTKGPSPKRRSPSPPPRRSSTDDSSSDEREPEPEPEPPRLAGRGQHLLAADDRMPSPILALVEDDAGESEGADDVLVADLIDEALGCGDLAQVDAAIAAYGASPAEDQQAMLGKISSLKQYRSNLAPAGAPASAAGSGAAAAAGMQPSESQFLGDSSNALDMIRSLDSEEGNESDGGSSQGSLGAWEEAERLVLEQEEESFREGSGTGQWISDGARPADLPWSEKMELASAVAPLVSPRPKAIAPVPVQEAEQAEAEGNACNEKCIRTQAGRTWTKVEAHWSSQGLLMLLTLVALFADDVRVLFVSKESDHMWSVMTIIVLVIFTVEWAGNSTFQRGYFMSMFFFLDLLATLSLLTDIHWIGDDFYGVSDYLDTTLRVCSPGWPPVQDYSATLLAMELGDQDGTAAETAAIARTGRSARIGARAARIVRIVRLCRVLRVFRMMRYVQNAQEDNDEENEVRTNPTKIGKRVSVVAAQRVVLIVLGVFVATSLSHTIIATSQDYSPVVGLAFMQAAPIWANEERGGETNTTMNEAADDFLRLDTEQKTVCLKNTVTRDVYTMDQDAVDELRNQELELYWSDDNTLLAVVDVRQQAVDGSWCNLISITGILVILIGSSAILTQDSNDIVVVPIQRIIESVNKMEKTLSYLTDADGEALEMQRIAGAMDKMALLLKIGFGDAGNAIISKNMMAGNRLDVMLPGRHVTAIFGFCDIRRFTDTTEVLRAQVMPFVNFCASIVHGSAKRYGGNPNKNVGDAFLIVWKTETFDKLDTVSGGSPDARAAQDDGTIQLDASSQPAETFGAQSMAREVSMEANDAKRAASRRRRLSLGGEQISEVLATKQVQEMLEEAARNVGPETPTPKADSSSTGASPAKKVPRKRAKRRARPKPAAAEQAAPIDEESPAPSPAKDSGKKVPRKRAKRRARPKPGSPEATIDEEAPPPSSSEPGSSSAVFDEAEMDTPRYRRTHDAPQRDTPRTRGGDGVGESTPPTSSDMAAVDESPTADRALQCFLECIAQIREKRTEIILRRKLPRLFMIYPNYKLALGFGLHHGWAIEGSLGSQHKVDASYLSPHVTLSDTLEAATKQYQVPLLMSGQFVKILSPEWRKKCRVVDRVQLAGGGDSRRRVYELFTCDHWSQEAVNKKSYKFFLKAFSTAVLLYIQGAWPACQDKLEECIQLKSDDGPTKKLQKVIRQHGGSPPEGWKGYRTLD